MSIALSSLGVRVAYAKAKETNAPSAETFSQATFKLIPEVKSIPSLSPSPDTLETTPLENTEYKTYINGLKDLGGALEFTANLTQELLDVWNGKSSGDTESLMYTYEHLDAEQKEALWILIYHPKLDKSVAFMFEPARLGMPEIAVNSVLEATLSITPVGEVEWIEKEWYPEQLKTLLGIIEE